MKNDGIPEVIGTKTPTPKKRKYWYKFESYLCPVCCNGEGEWVKTRVYGKKPKSIHKRYVTHLSYDWCVEWGGLCF